MAKTIIKITKQEAIDAWKKENNYKNDTEIIVEIEDVYICNVPNYIRGVQPLVSTPTQSPCPMCGKYGQHNCVTF